MTRPLRIVGLMAVLALAGTGCTGSDGSSSGQAEVSGAPVASAPSAAAADEVPEPRTTPTGTDEAGPTCTAAVEGLTGVLDGASDVPEALQGPGVPPEATLVEVGKVLGQAAAHAGAAGQDEAERHLGALAQLASDAQAALAGGAVNPMAAYTPAYFEHGYAAAELRELATTANLAPCGTLADLVVGAEG